MTDLLSIMWNLHAYYHFELDLKNEPNYRKQVARIIKEHAKARAFPLLPENKAWRMRMNLPLIKPHQNSNA